MKDAILGIDIGTSAIKCNLFDTRGRELLTISSPYETTSPKPQQMEIDPDTLWKTVRECISNINKARPKGYKIASMGICGVMVMPVLLDNDNEVIRPIIHWFDKRLHDQYFELKKEGKDKIISKYSGSSLTGESTANALCWVKENEPDNYKKINKFFMLKDFIRFRLTGKVLSDFGDASGTQLLDTRKWKWSSDTISGLNLNSHIFPELASPADIGGNITREASAQTGLAEGLPVAVGSGDGITILLGLGIYKEGDAGVIVGSAGVIGVPSKKFPYDEKNRAYLFCHPLCDRWYSLMATSASGEVFRWYNKSIIKDNKISYRDLDLEASSSPPGSGGLIFLPYILGARNPHSNPKASGMLLGLKYDHDRSFVTRAILEGISFELLDILDVQKDILNKNGIKINRIKLSGGITKSNFWIQVLADIFQAELVLTKVKESGTLGAAAMAAAASGIYPDLTKAIDSMVADENTVKYNTALRDIYLEKFKMFKELYKLLEPKFESL